MTDLIEHARRNPGQLNYGSPGVGTSLHLTMEQIAQAQRIEWTHIPFRGFAENIQSLLAGQTQILADSSGWAPWPRKGACASSPPGATPAPSASPTCRR
jgi:tripartite-type tricarboxylate transporter receptor subunit TctC